MSPNEQGKVYEFNSPDYHRAWLGHKVTKFGQRLKSGFCKFWFKCECGMEWQ